MQCSDIYECVGSSPEDERDSEEYSSVFSGRGEGAVFDGYEYIEESEDTGEEKEEGRAESDRLGEESEFEWRVMSRHKEYDTQVEESDVEWRVMSRLEGEPGDDWRILGEGGTLPKTEGLGRGVMGGTHVQQRRQHVDIRVSKRLPESSKLPEGVQDGKVFKPPVTSTAFLERLVRAQRSQGRSVTFGEYKLVCSTGWCF